MLDRLPPELLDDILDHLPPRTLRPWKVPEKEEKEGRIVTLFACCLVSKRVHHRAVLLLWRDIQLAVKANVPEFVKTAEDVPNVVDTLEEGSPLSKIAIQSMQLFVYGEPESAPWRRTMALVQQFSSMRSFELDGGYLVTIDLRLVSTSFPLLVTLRLAEVGLNPITEDTIFPHLLCLTLHCLAFIPASTASLPSRKNCPRLRALVFNPIGGVSDDALLTSFDPELRQQLDMLQIHGTSCLYHPILQSHVEILVTVEGKNLTYAHEGNLLPHNAPCHLRLWLRDDVDDGDDDIEAENVHVLSGSIGPSSRSLHLPDHLEWACGDWDDVLFDPLPVLDHLLVRCIGFGVEVVWHSDKKLEKHDLAPSFWRYAKRLKAERAEASAPTLAGQA